MAITHFMKVVVSLEPILILPLLLESALFQHVLSNFSLEVPRQITWAVIMSFLEIYPVLEESCYVKHFSILCLIIMHFRIFWRPVVSNSALLTDPLSFLSNSLKQFRFLSALSFFCIALALARILISNLIQLSLSQCLLVHDLVFVRFLFCLRLCDSCSSLSLLEMLSTFI